MGGMRVRGNPLDKPPDGLMAPTVSCIMVPLASQKTAGLASREQVSRQFVLRLGEQGVKVLYEVARVGAR